MVYIIADFDIQVIAVLLLLFISDLIDDEIKIKEENLRQILNDAYQKVLYCSIIMLNVVVLRQTWVLRSPWTTCDPLVDSD